MELFRDHGQLPRKRKRSAIVIGSFDGLHQGHQYLIRNMLDQAKKNDLLSGVLTFEPHPARALAPGMSPPLLMTYDQKVRALASLAPDFVLAQHFSKDFAQLNATDFVEKVLVESLAAQIVVVGDDFTFGRKRMGHAQDLLKLGQQYGFEVQVVQRLEIEGMIASSTRIRSFLLQGRVRATGLLLGRPYTIEGQIVTGKQRGRKIGYPTANLRTEAELLPARGVYTSHAFCSGWPHGKLSVTNIGVNPTFGAGPQTIETHILDFDENIVNRSLALSFRERLRDEVAFTSIEDLVDQIDRDVVRARDLAKSYPVHPMLDSAGGIELDTVAVLQG